MEYGVTLNNINLRKAYMASGKTYVELSHICNIDRRHISNMVNGARKTALPSTVGKLARALDVSTSDLYLIDEKELILNMVFRKLKKLTEDELEYVDDCINNILGDKRKESKCSKSS